MQRILVLKPTPEQVDSVINAAAVQWDREIEEARKHEALRTATAEAYRAQRQAKTERRFNAAIQELINGLIEFPIRRQVREVHLTCPIVQVAHIDPKHPLSDLSVVL